MTDAEKKIALNTVNELLVKEGFKDTRCVDVDETLENFSYHPSVPIAFDIKYPPSTLKSMVEERLAQQ